MSRCITCLLSSSDRIIATDYDGPDFASVKAQMAEAVFRRERTSRPGDMPSRADRRRARRLAHTDGFAWILSRRVGSHTTDGEGRP